jgi:dienelactone hydrolase
MRNCTGIVVGLGLAMVLTGACKKKSEPASAPAPTPPATPEVTAPPAPATPAIGTEEVTYKTDKTVMKGFLAYPDDGARHPGVLVVHEWWGHNEYTRTRARQLAEMGYVALAVDMYGDGKHAEHPKDAKAFVTEAMKDLPEAMARFEAARAFLAASEHTRPDALAAIGYCFGGGVVLNMARQGVDLDVVASFHGSLAGPKPIEKGVFAGKVFVAHGGADANIGPDQVEAFKKEMDAAGVDYELAVYEGATHAFTNPGATELGEKFGMPIKYDEAADKASWKQLEEILAAAWPK